MAAMSYSPTTDLHNQGSHLLFLHVFLYPLSP
jgi:hypothetical protein